MNPDAQMLLYTAKMQAELCRIAAEQYEHKGNKTDAMGYRSCAEMIDCLVEFIEGDNE
jgi:hypothetical protein